MVYSTETISPLDTFIIQPPSPAVPMVAITSASAHLSPPCPAASARARETDGNALETTSRSTLSRRGHGVMGIAGMPLMPAGDRTYTPRAGDPVML
ncbi:hypothetical protein NSND_63355 [Nitrospira sp. ND1]|nr:hypothetical protein NSND_63355 [Nitrospira sp. ND1]